MYNTSVTQGSVMLRNTPVYESDVVDSFVHALRVWGLRFRCCGSSLSHLFNKVATSPRSGFFNKGREGLYHFATHLRYAHNSKKKK
jgi:hypothetical protein